MEEKNEIVRNQISTSETGLKLRSLDDMFRFAQYAVKSQLVPDGFKTAEQVLIAIQSGAELSLPPMKALSSICVIKGRPTLWGDVALGLVRNSGLCDYCKEYYEIAGKVVEDKDLQYDKIDAYPAGLTAVCETKRKGEYEPAFRYFSIADAKLAGLWKKSGPWMTHPKRMLKYKARAFNLRDIFPDVLGGMHLTEELIDQEILPAPKCDTPTREERRKPAQDVTVRDVTPATADMEGIKEEDADVKTMVQYADVYGAYLLKNGIADNEEASKKFKNWAAYELCVEEEDVDKPEQFTDDMLKHLKGKIK